MSDKPMLFFAGVSDDVVDANADYDAINALHDGDDIGSYDAATDRRDAKEIGAMLDDGSAALIVVASTRTPSALGRSPRTRRSP
jgi:hypothetical protein